MANGGTIMEQRDHFCQNSQCQLYSLMVGQSVSRARIQVGSITGINTMRMQEVDRLLYRKQDGSKAFLCSVCHNAVELIIGR